jgi:hypothetical protein
MFRVFSDEAQPSALADFGFRNWDFGFKGESSASFVNPNSEIPIPKLPPLGCASRQNGALFKALLAAFEQGWRQRETVAILRSFLKTGNIPGVPVLTGLPIAVPFVTPLATDHSEKHTSWALAPLNDSSSPSLIAEF